MRTILTPCPKLNKNKTQTFESCFQGSGFCTQDAVFKNRYSQSLSPALRPAVGTALLTFKSEDVSPLAAVVTMKSFHSQRS